MSATPPTPYWAHPSAVIDAGAQIGDGTRVWSTTNDVATMTAAELTEIIGLTAHVRQGLFHL